MPPSSTVPAPTRPAVSYLPNDGSPWGRPRPSVRELEAAIVADDIEDVRELLARRAPVNGIGTGGRQPIFIALERTRTPNGLAIALELVEYGADLFARDRQRSSPLSIACSEAGQGPEAEALIAAMLRKRASVCDFDDGGRTPLLNAALVGNAMAVGLLVAAGASVFSTDSYGANALHLALSGGQRAGGANAALVEHLLTAARAEPRELARLLLPGETVGVSPLGLAAALGDARSCALLLEAGAAPDQPEPGRGRDCRLAGRTPAELAALVGPTVREVFEAAADRAREREAAVAVDAMFKRIGLKVIA
jgi:hypothetical protein